MARTLIRAAEVVTTNGRGEVIRDGALIVEGESIVAVGPAADLAGRGPFDREIGSPGHHVALPGFVNAHHHAARPELKILPVSPLETRIPQLRQRTLPSRADQEIYDWALWDAIQHLKNGVTAVMDHHVGDARKSDYGIPAAIRAYLDSGIRAVVCPAAYAKSRWVYLDDEAFLATLPGPLQSELRAKIQPFPIERYFDSWEDLYRSYHGARGRIRLAFGPGGPEWCSEDLLLRMNRVARERGVGIHIHLLETRYQALKAWRTFGKSMVERLAELGVLGPDLACAHCVWLTENDQRVLAETGTVVIHNPASNLTLLSGISPVADGLKSGLAVGFGTDGNPLNDDHDYLADLRLGWYLQRPPGIGRQPLAPERMLELATRGGAAALWQGEAIGSLEPGKQADVVLLDRRQLYASPVVPPNNPVVQTILRRGSGRHVDTVMVAGRIVVESGRYLLAEENAIGQRVAESLARYLPMLDEADSLFNRLRPAVIDFYRLWDGEAGDALPPRHQYDVR
jgi:5-methylthioadenosine/S-adenosylhomocysteine deaminase